MIFLASILDQPVQGKSGEVIGKLGAPHRRVAVSLDHRASEPDPRLGSLAVLLQIADEIHQHGTIDHTPVYPREIVKRGLEVGASSIILAHNHPSGDPNPSRSDIDMTRQIMKAAEAVGIKIHDHIVVGKEGRIASMRNMGLI